MILEIEAMHEESAENKLDSFLSGLDLKKNEGLTVNGTSGVSTSNYKTSKKSSGLAAKSAVILYSGEVKGKG